MRRRDLCRHVHKWDKAEENAYGEKSAIQKIMLYGGLYMAPMKRLKRKHYAMHAFVLLFPAKVDIFLGSHS